MSVAELPKLLEHRYGMRVDELTRKRLLRVLADEAAESDESPEAHAHRVVVEPALQQRFLDRVTLQETSFFRDRPVFDALATTLLPDAIERARGGPLTVWSAGCAHGQEAWSLAMLLTELGAPRFEVVASDLSAVAAARAQAGVYGERELRGLDPARRDRFMERSHGRWRVRDRLRRHVRVVHQNAATEQPPVAEGACSLVLCRYVLIYLTPPAADELLVRIASCLAPGGRLVIGAAESLWQLSERFVPEALPHAVAYRRRGPDDGAGRRTTSTPAAARRLPGPDGARAARRTVARTPRTAAGTTAGSRGGAGAPAADAPDLIRQGEAAAARGDLPAAVAAFRGAAYLDPDDAVALVRLGLVLEAMGDPGARRALRAAWAACRRQPPGDLEEALGGFAAEALVRLLAEKLEEAG